MRWRWSWADSWSTSAPRVRCSPATVTVVTRSILVRSTAGLLDNFREAYWIAARTLAQLAEAGMPQKAVLEQARKRYATSLLLGEVQRPEGNTLVTLGNALNRYAEVGFVTIAAPPKGARAGGTPRPRVCGAAAHGESLGGSR